MTSSNHMCCHSCNGSQEPFSTRQCSASHGKGITKLSPHCCNSSLACPIRRFVSNRAYLGSFGTASWAFHEFERTRGKVTANMELNVSKHHTELMCLNVLEGIQEDIKSSVLLPFSLK
ncbi:transposable element Tcb1 transposase [Trichonephila clavipes]|uniref:Transposable element Tcb1 transposase n=1 Tax=Trichonephila clavipes TaxID=2585209 RepID=A0A8X6VFV4_TRICX|nr:transposable element Tcb1 transposase [Trichonephila clavipes]